jgi:hypothetical protein
MAIPNRAAASIRAFPAKTRFSSSTSGDNKTDVVNVLCDIGDLFLVMILRVRGVDLERYERHVLNLQPRRVADRGQQHAIVVIRALRRNAQMHRERQAARGDLSLKIREGGIALSYPMKFDWPDDRHLAEERIENFKPSIPLGKRFWIFSRQERSGLNRLIQSDDIWEIVTSLRGRKGRAEIKVLDTAYWVNGCSSLGRLRIGPESIKEPGCALLALAECCQSDGFLRGRLSRTLPKACDRPGCLSSTD